MFRSCRIVSLSLVVGAVSFLGTVAEGELRATPAPPPPACQDCSCKEVYIWRINTDPVKFRGYREFPTGQTSVATKQAVSLFSDSCPGGAIGDGTLSIKAVFYDAMPVVCTYDGTSLEAVECSLTMPSNFTNPDYPAETQKICG